MTDGTDGMPAGGDGGAGEAGAGGPTLRRRRLLTGTGGLVLAGALGNLPLTGTARAATETVTLFIGTTPDYANIYVARDKGYFEAEGLKLDIRLFPSGSAATDGFRSGKIDFVASGDIPAMRLWATMGAKIVAPTGYDGYTPVFMTKSTITTADDLRGKKIGTRIGSSAELFAQMVRDKLGLPDNAFTLTNLEPTDMVAALDGGSIDGFLWYSPFEERSLQISGSKVRLFLRGEEVGSTNEVVLNARADLIANQPELVIRFVRALIKGSDYATAHRDETVDIVAAALKLDRKAADVTRKMNFPVRFDKRLYERYKQSADFMLARKFTDKPIDFKECFWTAGVASVDPSRVEKMS